MRSLLISFLVILPFVGQCTDGHWMLGARAHYGFLVPHRASGWILIQGHNTAAELFMERKLPGDRPWQRDYIGPSYGFGFMYAGLADPERIGAVVRLVPYLHLPIVRGERSTFGMRLGWGIGYVEKAFDRVENTKQIAIGSRINTAIQLMAEYRLQLGRTMLTTGLSLDHWSNGSFALPNLGLNLVTANVGVGYALSEVTPYTVLPDTTPMPQPRREQTVVASFAMSETGRAESGQFSVYSVVGQAQWRLTRKSSVSAGLDLFNKGALATLYPELLDRGRAAYTQVGVHGGYALGFGRGELMFQMGMYAYSPEPDASLFFHRFGWRYRFGKHLVGHLALKSHYAVADHWECGIGYKWN